jgi:hypothetical protein
VLGVKHGPIVVERGKWLSNQTNFSLLNAESAWPGSIPGALHRKPQPTLKFSSFVQVHGQGAP